MQRLSFLILFLFLASCHKEELIKPITKVTPSTSTGVINYSLCGKNYSDTLRQTPVAVWQSGIFINQNILIERKNGVQTAYAYKNKNSEMFRYPTQVNVFSFTDSIGKYFIEYTFSGVYDGCNYVGNGKEVINYAKNY